MDIYICPKCSQTLKQDGVHKLVCFNCGKHYLENRGVTVFSQNKKWEENYSGAHEYYSSEKLSMLDGDEDYMSYLAPQPDSLVLDVGCGDGVYLTSTPSSCNAIGFDVSFSALVKAASRGIPNVKWICSDDGFPLKDNSVDYVICIFVVEHLTDAQISKLLKDIRRVLNKNGKALFVTDGPFYDVYFRPLFNLVLRGFLTPLDKDPYTGHINLMQRIKLSKILKSENFSISSSKVIFMGWRFLPFRFFIVALKKLGLGSMAEYFFCSKYSITCVNKK
ncbi:class I SAM-dependent methyltransferase [Prochlorococcus marinus]|uniref:class I SAM-dependent methyltransferase n=1 Tax=Prochlorococcus marinus TaxID=1219 RepID=UPI0039AE98F5